VISTGKGGDSGTAVGVNGNNNSGHTSNVAAGNNSNNSTKTTANPPSNNVVNVNAGSKNNWDKKINGELDPSTKYQLNNGHAYTTDGQGRVAQVEATLDLNKMDRNSYQQCVVGKCGNPGDEGGHLIASSLGGAGDKINIVPQSQLLNRGDWKAMENTLRREMEAGKTVTVKIDVSYPPAGGVRPSTFTVIANVDGKIIPYRFNQ
jgi:DNA/RNA non-specific endonuclease.